MLTMVHYSCRRFKRMLEANEMQQAEAAAGTGETDKHEGGAVDEEAKC